MRKILAIEDDPLVMDNILDILELEEDYAVISATNGREGVQKAQEHHPDLILCDVMMPHMNGYEVLRTLRAEEPTATTPFIFLTAKADRSDQRQGMELGANDYLTKPFTPRELLQTIETRLQQQGAMDQKYESQIQNYEAQIREIQKRAKKQSYLDVVTGLPNRLTLGDCFMKVTKAYSEDKERLFCITSLRIDRFSTLQHELGYKATDQLLRAFAQGLQGYFSKAFVARVSDAEFVLIFSPVKHKTEITTAIKAFQAELAKPFRIDGKPIFLTISAGLTLYPRDGRALKQILQHSQMAIAQVERQGGNGYEFYSAVLSAAQTPILDRETEAGLRNALVNRHIKVYYQPKLNIRTLAIEGCEALLGWVHPLQGFMEPKQFLPFIEESSLSDGLGEYVLEQACQQVKQWQTQFKLPLTLAVHVSSRQFNRADLRQQVLHILADNGLAPECLELELTEDAFSQDAAVVKRRLDAFRHTGLKITLGDFGMGAASLQSLQQFVFDTLKINRCFINEVERKASHATVTQAIIEMAHQLELQVIAEGVERETELDWLKDHGCDMIQGIYFSLPVSANEFTHLLGQQVQ
ncbi:MAG: EAL domain-containing protein [Cyanobacteria bacterium P01_G01_bin.54]